MRRQQVEALLRLWAATETLVAEERVLGAYKGRAVLVSGRPEGYASRPPQRPDAAEVERQKRRVEIALEQLAPTLRRLLRLKYQLGLSDQLCRDCDPVFGQLGERDFRMLKRNALELLEQRLR